MKTRSRRMILAASLAIVLAALAGLVVVTDATARPHEPVYPPEYCSNCDPAYVGPNGGVCEPLGCIRTNGQCVYAGDCF